LQADRYSAIEALRDGASIEIRALQPSDRDELLGALGRMSDQSIRRRFFAPKRHFSPGEVERYVNVDFVTHVALVAVCDQDGHRSIAGAGRYVLTEPGVAEVAFAMDDAQQGRGIGGLLLRHLARIARAAGLRELVAEVLAENAPMLRVFRKSGLEMTARREDGVVHVALRLA
jgi:GNAT superfamily N-acetyltransferase